MTLASSDLIFYNPKEFRSPDSTDNSDFKNLESTVMTYKTK